MEGRELSVDERERQLVADELLIARLRARQLENLAVLDRLQVASGDGCKSLGEWVAARLDVGLDTARILVRTMRRLQDRSDLREVLASGEVSFDRVEALSRIRVDVGLLEMLDVGGVRREAARRAEVGSETEQRSVLDRFLVIQPSLGESWWKGWFGLDGASGAVVDKVLSEMADRLPLLPDGSRGGDSSWRRATALVELCNGESPPPAQITVFVDAEEATGSNGRAGVILEAGPRVGAQALEAVLCDGITEVTVKTTDGRFMEYGRRRRTVPPALRRAVIHRDGGVCAGDGCDSRYRLQVHHIIPWWPEGRTDPDNLITLCWFHHQIVVHERGFQIYRHPVHGRIRFRGPDTPAKRSI